MKESDELVLRSSNIALVLDSYEDLFSDFDPRDYSVRALSEDFLNECKRVSVDKHGEIELRFLLSKKIRDSKIEQNVKERLKAHFNRHYLLEHKKIKSIKRMGLTWFFVGVVLMVIGAFLYSKEGFGYHLLVIMIEPAGWFMFWEGLDKVFINANEEKPMYEFYKKMKEVQISFIDY